MAVKEHRIELTLRCPPAVAWSFLSDTNRADSAAGLPAVTYRDDPQPDGTSRRFFSYRLKGLRVEGEEHPFTWEEPRHFRVDRDYSRGMFEKTVHTCTVEPLDPADPSAGSRAVHVFTFHPRGMLGAIFAGGFGREVVPAMRAFFEGEDARIAATRAGATGPIAVGAAGGERATPDQAAAIARLAVQAREVLDAPIIERIARTLIDSPDLELQRLRPLALARAWGAPPQEVLDAFLATTQAGLTTLRWDVICPHCRGDKQNLARLDEVTERSFCPSCNIDFDVDLDRSLEAVFEPHPQARRIEVVRYCLGGPGVTRHVRAQHQLAPDSRWAIQIPLGSGSYRLRCSGESNYRWIRVCAGADESGDGDFVIGPTGIVGADLERAPGPIALTIENRSGRPVLVALEDVEWAADALPAGRLVAAQRFRDLFTHEMLAPGVRLRVEQVAILFTDLVGSTAMYGVLGDARAFSLVWSHFDALRDVVARHNGGLVKTIGDAIMACFTDAGDAVRAAAELHERLDAHLAQDGHDYPATLKIGLHAGPAIAVTLNDRLDYFGTTVNLAARIEAQSRGDDIVISRETALRIDAAGLLADAGWVAEAFSASAKGFAEPVQLLRFARSPMAPDPQ